MLLKPEMPDSSKNNGNASVESKQENKHIERFYEELAIAKEVSHENSVSVSVRKCSETAKNLLHLETDIPGDVAIHWGVCKDNAKRWVISAAPYPPQTTTFRSRALQTLLQPKVGGSGSSTVFTLDEELEGFLFVFKLNENTWVKSVGNNDFCIPLSSSNTLAADSAQSLSGDAQIYEKNIDVNQVV